MYLELSEFVVIFKVEIFEYVLVVWCKKKGSSLMILVSLFNDMLKFDFVINIII